MPTTRRSRIIEAGPDAVWDVVADPHHLPRWWPRVSRVEAVDADRWTEVRRTDKGRSVRADFELLESRPRRLRRWGQLVEDSPFERLLDEAVTEVRLEPSGSATLVEVSLRQRMRGLARLGGFLVRRAARRVLDEALEGLERASVR